jgi:hypothetical protein
MPGLDRFKGFETYQENTYRTVAQQAGLTPNPILNAARIKLTIPGPQYLLFLEEYARPIGVSPKSRKFHREHC